MLHKEKNISGSGAIISLLVIASALILKIGFLHNTDWYFGLVITLPLLLIAIFDGRKSRHSNQPSKDRVDHFSESIRLESRGYYFGNESAGTVFGAKSQS